MIGFIIAPFFVALLIFTYFRILNYLKSFNNKYINYLAYLFGVVFIGGAICLFVGFFLNPGLPLKRTLTKIGYYWIGILLYFFIGIGICLLIRSIIYQILKNKNYNKNIARSITTIVVATFTLIMSLYGIFNAHDLKTTSYSININKKANVDELNVVLISDLHLGYNVGLKEIEDMVNKVNACKPDVVILAGDIFDNEFKAVEEPNKMSSLLNKIDAKYKYAILGNHDIEEKIFMGFSFKENKALVSASEKMLSFITDSGFKLLYDSYEMIEDSIYVYGRPNKEKINLGNTNRKLAKEITSSMDLSLPIICIDHSPGELQELADAGIDLDLSGHTHNGQIWPGTISIKWIWENAYGLIKKDDMYSIVTSGVGLFGLNMRTGCIAEIVDINIKFK